MPKDEALELEAVFKKKIERYHSFKVSQNQNGIVGYLWAPKPGRGRRLPETIIINLKGEEK